MRQIKITLICIFVTLTLSGFLLIRGAQSASHHEGLVLYCAAGLRVPVSEFVEHFERETSIPVHVTYNGSGALLTQLQLKGGDLYLPADEEYIREAQAMGLALAATPLFPLTAKIVVHRDNTKIHSYEDLSRPNLRISFADESSAIGRFSKELLTKHQLFEHIRPNIVVTKPTVNSVLEDVALGAADATIAWSSVADNFKELRCIEMPLLESNPRHASIAILKNSNNRNQAQQFIDLLRSSSGENPSTR
ncbi:molybdate ABC transporter substrate-binding protein [Rubritalea marina]|uniref:molybdate ABC transporter substrate-binding protein n=1 Tax=Rubritalea marina TaxID=361055 RepID=UPI000378FAF0|nr:molybdate ABC transporter substrate-binding protein [Rubritalea marina]